MQNSKKVLSFINLQHSLLLSSGNQFERLTVDLNRIDRTNPAYSAASLVKTAVKLIAVGEEIGLTIVEMLELSHNKAEQNQRAEDASGVGNIAAHKILEAHRSELVTLNAATRMQHILHAIANRCNENLVSAHIKTMDQEQSGYLPSFQELNTSLRALRNLTMSYAQDLLDQGRTIEKYDNVAAHDGFEARTQKETLHMVLSFAKAQMEKAVALADIAIGSIPSQAMPNPSRNTSRNPLNPLSPLNPLNPSADSQVLTSRLACLSAYGIAAATTAKFITDMVSETLSAIGTVTVVVRRQSERSEVDIYEGLTELTSSTFSARLN